MTDLSRLIFTSSMSFYLSIQHSVLETWKVAHYGVRVALLGAEEWAKDDHNHKELIILEDIHAGSERSIECGIEGFQTGFFVGWNAGVISIEYYR